MSRNPTALNYTPPSKKNLYNHIFYITHGEIQFVGELNCHYQEWLDSTTTNRHGLPAFDFATVSGCDQLVVCQTHARGGILDLLMIDVPDRVRVVVVAPIGNSDHSSLSAVISMAQAVPNL